mgnify:CR=1 FL=1
MKAGWQSKAIGDVCDVVNGGTPKTGISEYWDGEHLWITPAEMGNRPSPYVEDTERKITDRGLLNPPSARAVVPIPLTETAARLPARRKSLLETDSLVRFVSFVLSAASIFDVSALRSRPLMLMSPSKLILPEATARRAATSPTSCGTVRGASWQLDAAGAGGGEASR